MTSDDRADLRRLYERGLSQSAAAGEHPDEALWERVFANDATQDERRRLAEHVVTCRDCSEFYRGLAMLRREAAAFDPDAPRPVPRRGVWSALSGDRVWTRRLVYAAAALATAAVVPMAWRARQARTASGGAVASSAVAPSTSPAPSSSGELRNHPAFRLDKPAVVLSVAVALTPRGAADDREAFLSALGPGLDAYRQDRFEDAAGQLEAVSARYPSAVEPPLYAGISLLLLNRPREAGPLLERAYSLANGELRDEAGWRLALAHVYLEELEKARPELQRLCATGNAYQARACDGLGAVARPK